jgi:hypothetical protein
MKYRIIRNRTWWLGLASALLLGAAVMARSSDPDALSGPAQPSAEEAAPSATAATAATAGARAVIDPATGKLTSNPSQAQLQQMALASRSAASSRSMAGLQPFELRHGGRGVNLQGRFNTAVRVERLADGSFHMTCGEVPSAAQAQTDTGSSAVAATSSAPRQAPLQ